MGQLETKTTPCSPTFEECACFQHNSMFCGGEIQEKHRKMLPTSNEWALTYFGWSCFEELLMRENIQGNQSSGQLNINKNNIKAQPLESVVYPNDFQWLPMFVFINIDVLSCFDCTFIFGFWNMLYGCFYGISSRSVSFPHISSGNLCKLIGLWSV